MKIKKLLCLLLVCIASLQMSFADIVSDITKKYMLILDKYEQSLSDESFQNLLDTVDYKIDLYLKRGGLSSTKRAVLYSLKNENTKRRVYGEIKNISENKTNKDISSELVQQKIIEETLRKNLEIELGKYSSNSVIEAFKNRGYSIYVTNPGFEFVSKNEIMRLNFDKYLAVNTTNYKSLLLKDTLSKLGDALVFDGQFYYIPKTNFSITKKNRYSSSENMFLGSINREKNYVKLGDEYFTYEFDSFLYFKDNYGFYDDDLDSNNIIPSESLLLSDGDGFKIIKNFEKKRLIGASVLSGVEDIDGFLGILVKDSRYTDSQNNDKLFTQLKNKTKTLTSAGNQQDKIALIYNFILENHYYYEDFTDGTEHIFSGIDTYKNGYGVCDGYSKLMYYMLAFAGIKDIEQIRGYVLDAVDFPQIGHAWVRIGNYYYDPTFDDPIGLKDTLTQDRYRYYKLPKDIAYTNRIDGFNVSDEIKNLSLSDRERMVEKNIFSLLRYYDTGFYNLLTPFQVKQDLGIVAGEQLTISKLQKKLQYFEVASDFSFEDDNGQKKFISELKYYIPTDENIDSILEQLGEDFVDSVLLKWDLGDGNFEYRLAYVFETR